MRVTNCLGDKGKVFRLRTSNGKYVDIHVVLYKEYGKEKGYINLYSQTMREHHTVYASTRDEKLEMCEGIKYLREWGMSRELCRGIEDDHYFSESDWKEYAKYARRIFNGCELERIDAYKGEYREFLKR